MPATTSATQTIHDNIVLIYKLLMEGVSLSDSSLTTINNYALIDRGDDQMIFSVSAYVDCAINFPARSVNGVDIPAVIHPGISHEEIARRQTHMSDAARMRGINLTSPRVCAEMFVYRWADYPFCKRGIFEGAVSWAFPIVLLPPALQQERQALLDRKRVIISRRNRVFDLCRDTLSTGMLEESFMLTIESAVDAIKEADPEGLKGDVQAYAQKVADELGAEACRRDILHIWEW